MTGYQVTTKVLSASTGLSLASDWLKWLLVWQSDLPILSPSYHSVLDQYWISSSPVLDLLQSIRTQYLTDCKILYEFSRRDLDEFPPDFRLLARGRTTATSCRVECRALCFSSFSSFISRVCVTHAMCTFLSPTALRTNASYIETSSLRSYACCCKKNPALHAHNDNELCRGDACRLFLSLLRSTNASRIILTWVSRLYKSRSYP